MDYEKVNEQERLKMFHPVHTFISKFVTNFDAKDLHQPIFEKGELVYENPSIQDIKRYVQENLSLLWEEYKRISRPEEYPVDLSRASGTTRCSKFTKRKSRRKKVWIKVDSVNDSF